jgi:hypothetical protein
MRVIAIAMVAVLTATASGGESGSVIIGTPGAHARRMENELFADYQSRRAARWSYANANKGAIIARIPTRIRVGPPPGFNPSMPFGNFIEMGRVAPFPAPYSRRWGYGGSCSPRRSCTLIPVPRL